VLYQPSLLFLLVGGVVLATAFHEIGHATAVRYGGAEPGVMGVGVYIVWPAFYTDITDAYRLGKWGRLRADTGGMYFNAVFALCTAAAYAGTGFEPLLLLVVLQNFAIFQQALPFLRLDGYYIVSDLTGVPDILSRIRPVLGSLLPGRPADDRVTELKPWVRFVVTGYILLLVPVLLLVFTLMLVHAPRAFTTAYDSLAVRYERIGPELRGGRAGQAIMDAFQMVVLALPCLGMTYTFSRIGHRAGRGAWAWSAAGRVRRLALVGATVTGATLVAFLWWPNGDYRPIQPQEKGTLLGGVRSLSDVPSGRAALPTARERQLGGAPTVRQRRRAPDARDAPIGSEPTRSRPDRARARTTPGDRTATPRTRSERGSGAQPPSSSAPSPAGSAPAATAPPATAGAPAPADQAPPAAQQPAPGEPTTTTGTTTVPAPPPPTQTTPAPAP
jgi:putative peptide zinc metalloprotease protein